MTDIDDFDSDDFPMSPSSLRSGQDFYETYLKCEEIFQRIPKKEIGNDQEEVFKTLFSEVDAQMHYGALFRQRDDANSDLTTLWLSRARRNAMLLYRFNTIPKFSGFSNEDMAYLVSLSTDVDNIRNISKYLFDFGIILIYEPSIASLKTDGAVFNIKSGNPVIVMSLRYSRIDSYWFTLMHELAHIVLHYGDLHTPIIDSLDDLADDSSDRREMQADKLALNSTISRAEWRSFPVRYDLKNVPELYRFAERVGVHPAIVAGRLRRELNRYDIFSKIVNEVDIRKVVFNE